MSGAVQAIRAAIGVHREGDALSPRQALRQAITARDLARQEVEAMQAAVEFNGVLGRQVEEAAASVEVAKQALAASKLGTAQAQ